MRLKQSHFTQVARRVIFMEQKLRFGLVGNTENNRPIVSCPTRCIVKYEKYKVLMNSKLPNAMQDFFKSTLV